MKSVICFSVPFVVARLYTLILAGKLPASMELAYLLRGFLADIGAGMAIGLLMHPLRRKKILYLSIWAIWVLLVSFNIEHIKVNASNMSGEFLGLALTREFFLGSVLSIKNLWNFLICAALSAPFLFFRYQSRFFPERALSRAALVLVIVSAAVLLPTTKLLPYWTQTNVLEENLQGLFRKREVYVSSRIDNQTKENFYYRDLSGEPIIKHPESKRNVLLIVLESMSFRDVMKGQLPAITSLSKENLSYANFVSLQHQTNRGLFSLLCGDYPNLLTKEAKSDIMGVYGAPKECLPAVLRENGYETVFMQSAALGFMRKDKFAAAAGFEKVYGEEHFIRAYGRNGWGVDDRTLFSYALAQIKSTSEGGRNWFLALLTAGTHHPYNVPTKADPTLEDALQYSNNALLEFFEGLREGGFLDNTLVLITTDEVRVSVSWGTGLRDVLSRHHAPLIALSPEITGPTVHEEPFTQSDIPLSITDYLDIPWDGGTGRSIFRTYGTGRNFMFASVYSRLIYGYSQDGRLYLCNRNFDCSAYRGRNGGFFDTAFDKVQTDPAFVSEFRQAAEYNELSSDKLKTNVIFYESDAEYIGDKMLLGQHKISAKAGDKIMWRLRITAHDDLQAKIRIQKANSEQPDIRDTIQEREVPIRKGDSGGFNFEFVATKDLPWLWTTVVVEPVRGNGTYRVDDLSILRLKNRP